MILNLLVKRRGRVVAVVPVKALVERRPGATPAAGLIVTSRQQCGHHLDPPADRPDRDTFNEDRLGEQFGGFGRYVRTGLVPLRAGWIGLFDGVAGWVVLDDRFPPTRARRSFRTCTPCWRYRFPPGGGNPFRRRPGCRCPDSTISSDGAAGSCDTRRHPTIHSQITSTSSACESHHDTISSFSRPPSSALKLRAA